MKVDRGGGRGTGGRHWRRALGADRGGAGGFARIGLWLFRRPVVGDGVQRAGLAHALAFVIDDDSRGGIFALEAHLCRTVGQVARSFKADGVEGEGVIGADVAFFLDEEQFVVGLVRRQEAHAMAVQGEAVQRAHAQDGMDVGIVVFLDPVGELAVERFETRKVQLEAEELFAHTAKKSLHLSLRRSIPYRGVGE